MSTRALLLRRHSVLPGFNLALGFALLYLCFIVLIPLSAVFLKTFTVSWGTFVDTVTSPRVVASYRLTFGASLLAALVNARVRAAGRRGCWCATAFRASASSTRWSTCRSRCRRRWPASR